MAPGAALRRLFEQRISELTTEVEDLFAEARERGRQEFADCLNQAVRRIRQSETVEQTGATLLDAAAGFASAAALFLIDGETARGARIRGVSEETAAQFADLELPLPPALSGAVASRDPVVAVATPSEVSARLAALLDHSAEARVTIFPLIVRDSVPALVYAWGPVQSSAIELLAQVAAAVWAENTRPPAPPPLVQIAPPPEPEPAPAAPALEASAPPTAPEPPASAWERLPAAEQQLHLRAQRFARVRVAEMRLHEAETVQSGRARRDLYTALQQPIDAGREEFRQSFFGACPSMVDYFHLELVRTLANEDAELLGENYPGPIV